MKVVPVLLAGAGLLVGVAFLTAQEIRKNGFTPSPPGPLQFVNGKRYRITVNIPSDGAVITQDLVTSLLRGSALDPQFPPPRLLLRGKAARHGLPLLLGSTRLTHPPQ